MGSPAATIWLAVTPLIRPDPLSAWIREPQLAGGLLIAAALVVGTAAIVSLVRHDRARHRPTFRRMCRALRLSSGQRRTLDDIARVVRVPAASLLISRGCFDAAIRRAAVPRRQERRLAAVRRKVFG